MVAEHGPYRDAICQDALAQ